MNDRNIQLEAARYQPETPNTLGALAWMVFCAVAFALLSIAAYYELVEWVR